VGLLFDFCVEGPPISVQTRRKAAKARWKAKVLAAAASAWPASRAPIAEPVWVRITYFYDGAALDVDNMVKPILDAIGGLVYDDDKQIRDAHARKRDINGSFRIKGLSPRLALAFSKGVEFLHVEIFDQLDQQELV
jgi:crossover junction endodeoxyribonuclease RusA